MTHRKKYIKLNVELEVVPGTLSMAMPIITVQCKHCNKTSFYMARTTDVAMKYFLEEEGWNLDGHDMVCPDHTPVPMFVIDG